VGDRDGDSGVRLAELIAALSLGTDLGLGQPMEHVVRECELALGLAERFGLEERERLVVYYVALLAWVGCHADSYEQARWFGDDISARADVYKTDLTGANKARFVMRHVGAGEPPARRARTALDFLLSGRTALESMHGTHCVIAGDLARRWASRGLLNKEIARRLEITPKTVSNHVEHIYAKIGVSSRAAAGLFATDHGLLAVEASAGNEAAFA
jgi:hypothetical protein